MGLYMKMTFTLYGKLSVKHKQEKSNVYIIGSLSNDNDGAEEDA